MGSKHKKNEKNEVLFGINSVFEALKAGKRQFKEILFVKKGRLSHRINEIVLLSDSKHILKTEVSATKLSAITGSEMHQGIGAVVSPFKTKRVGDILKGKEDAAAPLLLLLIDSIVDPQNLGGLIRTARCAGVNGIFIPKDRAASPTPSVSRASAGAMEHTDIALVTNLVTTITRLQKEGFWIAGLDAAEESSIYKSDLSGPLGIVIGGEDKGVRPLVRKQCDFMVSIPQKGDFNSLNASVAGAIAMYEAFRQRQ